MQNYTIPAIDFAVEDFQGSLLTWYDSSRRDLPWRAKHSEVADPYRVWLSEVMLQQTTVKAVIPYFDAFVSRWPSASALAAAGRDEILAAWAGLGYYSRARNLHACAQMLAQSGFPQTEAGLRELPGIGTYTAAAISAIAFDQPSPVVDGNVERVLARLFALETPMPLAKPIIGMLAASLTPGKRPGDYAQAMMDLGATICTPRSPLCLTCPVRAFCAAAGGGPERYPLKAHKAKKPVRSGDAFVILRANSGSAEIFLRRRVDKGLLGGMMEVPGTAWRVGSESEGAPYKWGSADSMEPVDWVEASAIKHEFTHFHLQLRVFATSKTGKHRPGAGEWVPLAQLARCALPTVMKKVVAAGLEVLGIDPAAATSGIVSGVSVAKRISPPPRAGAGRG